MENVKLNYYALTVAIISECSIETAFEKLQSEHPDSVRPLLNKADNQDIRAFRKQGITWPEIASYYCTPVTTVYGRVRARKRKAC